ncbi:hypothetical protein EJ05DRAFT_523144 [Pseudovirgaria hyperparasitica]|uniref:Uncharacterized protein n=1 Tax=Pseudovirgaria hyperparasitica TaxID=470096 RepID=A0A6A6VST6_9PEZI|nr:uncharacterized protein EJ05DRAFT_523144 [Pseudovirgaria hyperparasitica]KAF2753215.1 hypothetical protein EJ05DRAFT_523144 [Pseudovirgaria hyperparasitica]
MLDSRSLEEALTIDPRILTHSYTTPTPTPISSSSSDDVDSDTEMPDAPPSPYDDDDDDETVYDDEISLIQNPPPGPPITLHEQLSFLTFSSTPKHRTAIPLASNLRRRSALPTVPLSPDPTPLPRPPPRRAVSFSPHPRTTAISTYLLPPTPIVRHNTTDGTDTDAYEPYVPLENMPTPVERARKEAVRAQREREREAWARTWDRVDVDLEVGSERGTEQMDEEEDGGCALWDDGARRKDSGVAGARRVFVGSEDGVLRENGHGPGVRLGVVSVADEGERKGGGQETGRGLGRMWEEGAEYTFS